MANIGQKRNHGECHNKPAKKVHLDNSVSANGHGFKNSPADNALLPPLPFIGDQYRNTVFTHQSTAGATGDSYDRLEFLGDAYLELIASQLIFERLPTLPVGRMSQVRESMVKNETIGQYSVLYGFDRQLKDCNRLRQQPPGVWLKIKGDVFEAYVAAVVLSHPDGFDVAKKWLTQLWEPKIEAVSAKPPPSTNSKNELARKISGAGIRINYVDERPPIIHYGKGTETHFVGVYLTGWGWENQYLGSGKGLSKVEAGQAAAAAALDNHPLIDEIAAKRTAFYASKKAGETQTPDADK
ncbi:hypothetical protein HRR83_008143 [Exophiala dermatitidis]|uniref:Ribonuclease III n=2 Tax=Exophiala dermatitidis TaxID=5970 RepID=H6BT29_EXODN|nr:ribonuclease III [Exophiala dermatitidis NIH/UT8656]KAJ4505869.1 hypothetical protein HRR75_007250 [Exophiala dermatitidis]EHY54278.1 ribonuclease III [Exophiala dermatitidis NIH/UT8656]KAJ4508017.1 hypothetical protein HRR74_007902 [Exophiala dermatitidis]KAJ4513573.1 hypothetical protein HRR73_005731 [Exophiala dermatitidis]KAJ4535584.1 hypothetical protein HRR77_007902 [Exophiala dermatitidis]